ncbi:MAG TPA: T9SS type A sorting domain-containing protein, partial [Pontibacter sp.]
TAVSGTVTGSLTTNAVAAAGTAGTTFDITISSISGTGTLRLDLKSSGTGISDEAGNVITKGFTTGQTYTVSQQSPPQENYSLTIATTGSGSVSKTPNQTTYASGSMVTLTATPAANYSFSGWSGDASGSTNPLNVTMTGNKTITAVFSPLSSQQQVVSFTLVNSHTEQDIQNIQNGAVINLDMLPTSKLNIRANTLPSTLGSVKFVLSGTQSRTYNDNAPPYALHGDDGNGNYYYGDWNPPATGSYTLTATPYSGAKGTGTAGTPLTVTFTFARNSTLAASSKTQTLEVPGQKALNLEVYPNPFTTQATIDMAIPEAGEYSLTLYDSKGAFVKELTRQNTGAGMSSTLVLDGRLLSPGLYFVKLNTPGGARSIKLMLTR